MADELSKSISETVFNDLLPIGVVNYFLKQVAIEVVNKIETLVSVRDLVVTGMTKDPATLGNFFQKVGVTEINFLIDSG